MRSLQLVGSFLVTRAELLTLVLAVLALPVRVAVSAGMSADVLRFYCLFVALVAAVVTILPVKKAWLDGPRLCLLLVALWSVPSIHDRVGGDGIEYYVQARSLLFDFDLDFENDYAGLGAPPIMSGGEVTSRMPVGVALFWIPAMGVAHISAVIASVLGVEMSTDGFSPYYQGAATSSTFFYGVLAIVLIELGTRRLYGRAIAFVTAAGIWFATPFYFYLTANPFMSHGVSVFTVTAFALSWWRARETEEIRPWVITGIWAGLMALVRVQDGMLILIPVLDLILSRERGIARRLGALLSGPAVAGVIQASIWFARYGIGFVGTVQSYGGLAESAPQWVDFLLSPRHGLLTWTPLFAASLLGWLLLLRSQRRAVLAIWAAFAVQVLFNSSTQDWWGADSFGQRRMLGMLPLFAWGLAEIIAALRRRPMWLIGGAMLGLAMWNAQLAYIYNSMMVATRDDALTFDKVAEAQVELVYRRLLRAHRWMPSPVWVVLYDNLKGVWLHDGSRSFGGLVDLGEEPEGFYPLVGDGWFVPEFEDRISFRQSRGRRSWLTLLIRNPKDYVLTFRARREVEDFPVSARVDINGNALGELDLVAGWSTYRLEVPESVLLPGVNQLFFYPETPRRRLPGFRGRNTVMSVDWISLEPVEFSSLR